MQNAAAVLNTPANLAAFRTSQVCRMHIFTPADHNKQDAALIEQNVMCTSWVSVAEVKVAVCGCLAGHFITADLVIGGAGADRNRAAGSSGQPDRPHPRSGRPAHAGNAVHHISHQGV